jgi:prolyl-tRNA synthetase
MESDQVFMARRDKAHRDKVSMKREAFIESVSTILDEMQQTLFDRATDLLKENTCEIDDRQAFYDFFTPKNKEKPEIHGGFAHSHWCGNAECEESIKDELSVTIRCIPFDTTDKAGTCIFCGEPSSRRVIFAKAY